MKKFLFVLSGVIVAFTAMAGTKGGRDVSAPYNMYVEPGTHSCLVSWDDDENSAWNLRYRLFTDESPDPVLLHSLSGSSYTGSYADITLPAPWGGVNTRGGNGAIYIKNNYNGVATGTLTYTIPEGYTNAIFSMMIKSGTGSYGAGNFTVYTPQTAAVGHTFSGGETYSWQVTASSGEQITVYSTDDKYSPDIALIAVYLVDANDWTYVNDLIKTSYNIEGLEMETDYEVQVQAIGSDGTLSDWTRPDVFTTLDEEPIIPEVHILGEVEGQVWAPDAGTKTEYDPETETYTATVFIEADKTIGFTTQIDPNGDLGGWNYVNQYRFGPESNGLFDLTEERLGQQLPLNWEWDHSSDVHILSAGTYEITISLERNYIIIGKIAEPEHGFELGDVDHSGAVDIGDLPALIDYLLDNNKPICTIFADVDENGIVEISDVSALIDKLLAKD